VGGVGGLRGGVRGYKRFAAGDTGDRLAGFNAEWRFPIFPDINYDLWYLFPDFYFKALFGSIFTDAGSVWSSEGQLKDTRWRDVRHSVGVGLTLYTFILQQFPLFISMDYARRTTSKGDAIYVYLGPLF
jgi:outer membrane protein assembly factor BamA